MLTFARARCARVSAVHVLTLPGWLGSGAQHWQTRWERLHGDQRVEQHDWVTPQRGDWVARLEDVVLQQAAPVVLAAHSLGCQLIAAWAAVSRSTARVRGALLVAPPDLMRDDIAPALQRWRPPALAPLPFGATVVASQNDPFCAFERSAELAQCWRAALVSAGPRGHLNAESGLGDWPEGRALLHTFMDTH
ncbi:MAG: serine hydrolase family protein [Betaproteobacteria bacterium]|nr:serine hydrolase family protein [Betaproteobacteria bacterium]